MAAQRLSDRGFTSARGLTYTLADTAANVDAALPASHSLGALPSALELWVEVSAGEWEQQDPATYVLSTATQLTATATTLASVLGGSTNVRLIAAAGAVSLSVPEASETLTGLVNTGAQSFGGTKNFASDPTFSSGSQLVTTGAQSFSGAKTFTGQVDVGTSSSSGHLRIYIPNAISDTELFNIERGDGQNLYSIDYDSTSPGTLSFVTDTKNYVWKNGIGGAETMRITSTGAVSITNDTGNTLSLSKSNNVPSLLFKSTTGNDFALGYLSAGSDFHFAGNDQITSLGKYTQSGAWTLGPSGGADHIFNGTITGGTTGPDGAARMHLFVGGNPAAATNALKISTNNQQTNQQFIRFQTNSTTSNGGIERNGSNGVQFYSGSSDRRVKNEIGMMDPVLDKICQIQLKKWTYKDTGEEGCSPIAQELFEIFPEKVITTDDGAGDEVPEGVEPWALRLGYDWYFMKAIQELNAKLEAAEAEIETLKNPQP